jgi:hypothetical protein
MMDNIWVRSFVLDCLRELQSVEAAPEDKWGTRSERAYDIQRAEARFAEALKDAVELGE